MLAPPEGAAMKSTLIFAGLLAAALPTAAAVYRCSAPGKAVSYQEQPCDQSAIEDKVAIPTQYPDHVAERDRLAAREAAADARILERARIDSAERIARDDRAAREAHYAADSEQAQAADGWYPVAVGFPAQVRPAARVKARPKARPLTH
jgi:hypothetical protein